MKKNFTLLLSLFLWMVSVHVNAEVSVSVDGTVVIVTGTTAGDLKSALLAESVDLATITEITVSGNIDARDFVTMRDDMTVLAVVDITGATVDAYTGLEGTLGNIGMDIPYDAGNIPAFAFSVPDLMGSGVPTGKTTLTTVKISQPVFGTSILGMGFCFAGALNLETVVFTDEVKDIGANSFSGCTSLESVDFLNKVEQIGLTSFDGCTDLKSVVIPANVKSITNNAFRNCNNIESFVFEPSSKLTILNVGMFDSPKLKTVTIPASITQLHNDAFALYTGEILVEDGSATF